MSAKIDETKVYYHGTEEIDDNRRSYPPPYSKGQYGPPSPDPFYEPVYPASTTTTLSVATSVGVGTNVGGVGTNVGGVGTNVGVVNSATTYPVVVTQQISPKPTWMTCKFCNNQIVTRIETKPTTKTHFFAGLLCLVGCWCCVWIPYFTDSCMNSDHYCPNCNAYIGSYVP